ncbi:MAG: cytochrome c oxidase subunit 3 [Dehalococcoidia bacterium]
MATRAGTAKGINPIKDFFVGQEPMTNALWGMVFFIFSEVMFFSGLIAAYLALQSDALVWAPSNGAEPLDAGFRPIFFTIVLVTSSLPMQWAAFSIRKGNRRGMQWGMFLTIALGIAFLINQGVEWIDAGFGIGDGPYGATFFLLTGFHGAHVLGGLLFIMILFLRSQVGQFDAKRNTAVEAATMYWHFVDVVWIMLFSLIFVAFS